MRVLDKKFRDMFEEEYKGIIEYVKKHDDVFLGIRNNCIDLYVDGGKFLELSYKKNKRYCEGKIDDKYFDEKYIKRPSGLEKINKKKVENIQDWIDLFDELIYAIKKYQRGKETDEENFKKKREKILQQKLVKEFNTKSDYFAYDIEYTMEGVSDFVLDANKNKILATKKYRTKSLGRADIMLIGKPVNNKIKIYNMEVKEGGGAFSGVLPDASEQDSAPSFGSGIVGHLKNNVAIIKSAREGKDYIAKDGTKHYKIRETLLEEIKYALSFYTDFKLIKNDNFKDITKEQIENLEISTEENSVELVFFLGNYKKDSFEKYLGIDLPKEICSTYSVKNLLDNKMKDKVNLDYIKSEDLFDFKVLKTSKGYEDNNFDLDIEKYEIVPTSKFID